VLLIWGALALAVTVEQSFNQVLGCNVGRPWHRRIAIYWTVLSLGPVLVVTSLYVAGQIQAWIEQNAGMVTGWMPPLGRFTGVMASWTLFFLLYQLMPNTRVKLRASILGALIAALMWEAAKWAFNLYVTRAVPFSALYGSLGLIPLFLFWLYLSWLIVLFGLELTNALQVVGTIRMYEQMPDKRRPFCDPHAVISLMAAMADSFDRGVAVSREHMALKLGLPLSATDELLQRLRQAGLIFEVDGRSDEPPRYALAQSPRRIRLVDLLILARTFTTNVGVKTPGGECMLALQAAQDAAVEGKTLADLVQDAVAPAEVNAQPT